MKILLVDPVNYIDYPTGGGVVFDKQFLSVFCDDLDIVGISTYDEQIPIGVWTNKKLGGRICDFFSIKREAKNSAKPFIPRRIKLYFLFRKYIKEIISHNEYDLIITQSCEF